MCGFELAQAFAGRTGLPGQRRGSGVRGWGLGDVFKSLYNWGFSVSPAQPLTDQGCCFYSLAGFPCCLGVVHCPATGTR